MCSRLVFKVSEIVFGAAQQRDSRRGGRYVERSAKATAYLVVKLAIRGEVKGIRTGRGHGIRRYPELYAIPKEVTHIVNV